MNDKSSERPLTDQTLSRLRKLAEGNGLPPEKIQLIDSIEKIYTLEGTVTLVPFCETHGGRYAGPPRGKDRALLPNAESLHEATRAFQEKATEKSNWLPDALKELKAAPGGGWGLRGAKITLPHKSKIFVASEPCNACQGRKSFTCTQCSGQGFVVCPQCEGRGWELCYNCAGRGVNPAFPDQPCAICFGKRYAPCRFCTSTGKQVCPNCRGQRGTTCPTCRGAGIFTEEVALTCGANVSFRLKSADLPSGLRRGLDRVGIENLGKGHADIREVTREPVKDETGKPPDVKTSAPVLLYFEATLPYADLKIRFGDPLERALPGSAGARAVLVSAFGKRGALMGVPTFLDESLKPWRESLKQAATGQAPLEKALEARAMRDALALEIGGQGGNPKNLKKLYSPALSLGAAQEILLDMRRALRHFTRHVRLGAAIAGGAIGAGLLAGFILMPLHAQLTRSGSWMTGLMVDLFALGLIMTLGWIGLGKAVQFALKQHFPDLKIHLHRNAGNLGVAMLAGIFFVWLAILISLPEKPLWVLRLTGNG